MALPVFARSRVRGIGALLPPLALALVGGCGTGTPTTPGTPLPPLSRIVIALGADTLVVADTLTIGATLQFSATAYDTNNVAVAADAAWSSSNPGVFSVNNTGRVTAAGEGSAMLFAQVADRRDSLSLLVLPAVGGWVVQTSNSSRALNAVHFASDGRTGVVVGALGELLRTTDAGANWARIPSNTSFNLNGVRFATDGDAWAVGNNGTILQSTNAGASWSVVPSGTNDALLAVWFATRDTGWAVGVNGTILRTFDRGASWQKLNPTAFALRGVAFFGTRYGWAVGDNGTIVGTDDRGLSWTVVTPSVTAQALRAVSRLGLLDAWAVGAAGVTPRTVNNAGDPEWELQNAGGANDLRGTWFVNGTNGWAVGSNGGGIVLKTANGLGWTPQTVPAGTALNAVHFVDVLRGWAVGDNGRIVHTGNGGE
jgi:photosystem II stability/assembly factor-like uncharacterized protein